MPRRSPLLLDGRALLDASRVLEAGLADRRACFEISFARLPPHAGFVVIAGVEPLVEALGRPLVDPQEVERARDAGLVSAELAARLSLLQDRPKIDLDAMVDGTVVAAKTPVATVEGPLLEALLVSGLLRATVTRSTAIATRAARLCIASGGDAIVDASSCLAPTASEALTVARAAHVGGTSETTSVAASIALGIPYRSSPRAKLTGLVPPARSASDVWGASNPDAVLDLGDGEDEEAILLEAKRLGAVAGGWLAQGLGDASASALPASCELVAMEKDGAWAPRRGASGDADVVPGRKMVARYTDAKGRAVIDVIHLASERMQAPKSLAAATLTPLARPLVRAGRALEASEAPSFARDRAIAARLALPSAVAYLRHPTSYPIELSAGLLALLAAR